MKPKRPAGYFHLPFDNTSVFFIPGSVIKSLTKVQFWQLRNSPRLRLEALLLDEKEAEDAASQTDYCQ